MGLAAAIGSSIIAPVLGGIGLGGLATETVLGTALPTLIGGGLLGAGTGAAESAITGGDPLIGALTGGATGIGGPLIGGAIGEAVPALAGTAANTIGGAAVGAAGAGLTGGDPLLGAAGGAAGPLLGAASSELGITGPGGLIDFGTTGSPAFGTSTGATTAPTGAVDASGNPFEPASPTGIAPAGGGLTTPTTATAPVAMAPSTAALSGGGVGAAGSAAPPSVAPDPAASGLLDQPIGVTPLSNLAAPAGGTAGATDLTANPVTDASISTGGSSGGFLSNLSGGGSSTGGTVQFDNPNFTVGSYEPVTASGGGSTGGSSFGSSLGKILTNPAVLLGGGLLGLNYLNQPKTPDTSALLRQIQGAAGNLGSTGAALTGAGSNLTTAAIPSLESQAGQFSTQGTRLANYLQTGTLPPGVDASLNQAANEAKAATLSRYAAMGGGAETSSAAARDLANIDQQKAAQGAQIATSLLGQGVNEQQLASQIYNQILSGGLSEITSGIGATGQSAALYGNVYQSAVAQDQALQNSIARFAAALAGSGLKSTTTA